MEYEIEVTDETSAKAYLNDWGYDEDGNAGMVTLGDDDGWGTGSPPAVRAAQQVMIHALVERGAEIGVQFLGCGGGLRPSDGDVFTAWTLPAMRIRQDDGHLPESPGEGG